MAIDISKMKVCRPGDVINVGSKGEGAVQDDTQTLDMAQNMKQNMA